MQEVEPDSQFDGELIADGTAAAVLEQTQINTIVLLRIYDAIMLNNMLTEAAANDGGQEQTKKLADFHDSGGVLSEGVKYDPDL